MMDVLLRQFPYYLCAVASFVSAGMMVVAVYKHLRPRWFLVGSAAGVALGAGFLLIAVTSTEGGYLPRSAVALQIRWLMLAGGVLWCTLLALIARATVRVVRK